jgi:hypothetical protein
LIAELRTKKSCGIAIADLQNLTSLIPQLSAVSPFNWIDGMMQDVGRHVGMMLESEAIQGPAVDEADEKNVENGYWNKKVFPTYFFRYWNKRCYG